LYIPPKDGQQGPKHVAEKTYKIKNKHPEDLSRGMDGSSNGLDKVSATGCRTPK
jgi:hypothetical protein